MVGLVDVHTNFTSGELDPLLHGRGDIKHYFNGADKLRNVRVLPQGGAGHRPGLEYIATVENILTHNDPSSATTPEGATGAVGNLWDDDETTEMVTVNNIGGGDPYIAVRYDLGSAKTVTHADIIGINLDGAGSGNGQDEFFIQYSLNDSDWVNFGAALPDVDENRQDVRRVGSQSAQYWRVVKIGGTNIGSVKLHMHEFLLFTDSATVSQARIVPFEFSTTQKYIMLFTDHTMSVFKDGVFQIEVPTPYTSADLYTKDSVTGDITSINWTQNLDTLLVFHEDHPPRKFVRQGGHALWNADFWTLNNVIQYDFGSGAEDVWSATRGWPLCGTFFQGRLWFAGAKSRPQTIWASKSGNPEDFDVGTALDDEAIDVTADTDDVSAFFNVQPAGHLQFFSSSAEFYIPNSEDTGITPTNIVLRRTTNRGSKKGLRVFEVDGATFFLQRKGKSLREFLFVDIEQKYQANNMSLLSSHLIDDPRDSALRKSTSTDEADFFSLVNDDGTLAVLTTLRLQEVAAFTLDSTTGSYLNVGVDLDEVYYAIQRTIDGNTVCYLEKEVIALHMDAGKVVDSGDLPLTTITGLEHLEGVTIDILNDGTYETKTVASGQVTMDSEAGTSLQYGIPLPSSTPKIKTLPVESAGEGAKTLIGKKRRVVEVTLRLVETDNVLVNDNDVTLPNDDFTGDITVEGLLGWDDFGQITITQDEPKHLTVSAIAAKVAV